MASLCDGARATLDATGQPSNAAAMKGTARDHEASREDDARA
jgi:hypothetical protein